MNDIRHNSCLFLLPHFISFKQNFDAVDPFPLSPTPQPASTHPTHYTNQFYNAPVGSSTLCFTEEGNETPNSLVISILMKSASKPVAKSGSVYGPP